MSENVETYFGKHNLEAMPKIADDVFLTLRDHRIFLQDAMEMFKYDLEHVKASYSFAFPVLQVEDLIGDINTDRWVVYANYTYYTHDLPYGTIFLRVSVYYDKTVKISHSSDATSIFHMNKPVKTLVEDVLLCFPED